MDGSNASGFILEVACPFVGLGFMIIGFFLEVALPLLAVKYSKG